MTVPGDQVELVRQRAGLACEFCGVTEEDCGGRLTVDHFQPSAQGGGEDETNLLYCCYRCNLYKVDYWPTRSTDPPLWNPRREVSSKHLLVQPDGTLHGLTACGEFTIGRLRLNRPQLVQYRGRKLAILEEQRLLQRFKSLIELLERVREQQSELLREQEKLLAEQRELLNLLLNRRTE